MLDTSKIGPYEDSAGLPRNLLVAIVTVESNGDQFAFRPEPSYPYLWDVSKKAPFRKLTAAEAISKIPPKDFRSLSGTPAAEWWGQQSSWGLCQLMGAVARENGFVGAFPRLTVPEVNLALASGLLKDLLAWAGGDVRKAAAAYNGGRAGWQNPDPQNYAVEVLSLLA